MGGEMTEPEPHCQEFVADCRLRAATDLFAHTWDPVVLAALREGPRRRRELRAAIGGISDKVLTESLRRLLAAGLLERHPHPEVPPRVEYALTGLGRSLVEGPMAALGRWAVEHGDALLEAQERAQERAQAERGTAGGCSTSVPKSRTSSSRPPG